MVLTELLRARFPVFRVALVWNADIRKESVRLSADLVCTRSPLNPKPVRPASDLLVDPIRTVLLSEPASAYRADRIFIARYQKYSILRCTPACSLI